jgi:hypothetical protein
MKTVRGVICLVGHGNSGYSVVRPFGAAVNSSDQPYEPLFLNGLKPFGRREEAKAAADILMEVEDVKSVITMSVLFEIAESLEDLDQFKGTRRFIVIAEDRKFGGSLIDGYGRRVPQHRNAIPGCHLCLNGFLPFLHLKDAIRCADELARQAQVKPDVVRLTTLRLNARLKQ